MKFNLTNSSKFKKSFLLLCCSMSLSTPLFAIVATNETEKTVTCFSGTKNIGLPEIITTSKPWKKTCNFLKTPECKFYCTYKGSSAGSVFVINAFNPNKKYTIIKGEGNKPAFEEKK